MKKFLALVFCTAVLAGCSGGGYKDGTYTGQSTPDEDGEYSTVTITVQDNVITACDFKTFESNGEEKGEEYAQSAPEAAVAVDSVPEYAKALVAAGDIAEVDAISGATENYNQLNEAVYDALGKAQ